MEDLRMRATANTIDVSFLRNVMRYSRCLGASIRQFYNLGFLLAGVDPSNVKFDISFPLKGTADELIIAQTDLIRAQIAKLLGQDIGIDWRWVFKQVYNLSEEDIDEILKKSKLQSGAASEQPTAAGSREEAVKEILWQSVLNKGPMAGALNSISDILKVRKTLSE